MTGERQAVPAGGAEIAVALNELLEAERAGARVALASRDTAANTAQAALLRSVHADEARWCAMLAQQIERLGAIPSERCGAFYEKAMAIADPVERLHFLNRGQAWVVRRLEALVPRVQDAALQAALAEMLASHRANIDRTTGVLAG
jgi:hypothetical protein